MSSARWLGVLALFAVLFGRALSAALPGSTDGIGRFLRVVDVVASVSTQLFVLCALSAAVTLLVGTLWHRHLSYAYRLVALPAGSAVVLFVAISTQHRLQPVELGLMGAGAVVLATAASLTALGTAQSRAAGLVLSSVTAASACFLLSRVLSLGFWDLRRDYLAQATRALSTIGFSLDIASLGVAMAWVSARRARPWLVVFGAAAVIATALTWGGMVGSHDGAAVWQVIAARALAELAPHPAPLVTLASRYWVEAFAFLLSGVVLFARTRPAVLTLSVSLALLARGSVDIPVSALLLALGALLAPIESSRGGVLGMWKTWEQKNVVAPSREG